jgi:hypothetical protein
MSGYLARNSLRSNIGRKKNTITIDETKKRYGKIAFDREIMLNKK